MEDIARAELDRRSWQLILPPARPFRGNDLSSAEDGGRNDDLECRSHSWRPFRRRMDASDKEETRREGPPGLISGRASTSNQDATEEQRTTSTLQLADAVEGFYVIGRQKSLAAQRGFLYWVWLRVRGATNRIP